MLGPTVCKAHFAQALVPLLRPRLLHSQEIARTDSLPPLSIAHSLGAATAPNFAVQRRQVYLAAAHFWYAPCTLRPQGYFQRFNKAYHKAHTKPLQAPH